MFRASVDAVVIMDGDGVVRDWNPAAELIFGYAWEQAVGQPLELLIIPGELRAAHRTALRRYVATGKPTVLDRRLEFPALCADGAEIPIELTISRLQESESLLFAGFVRPLEDAAATRLENVRLAQRMTFLAEAGLVLDRSLDYEETLRSLAELTVPEISELTVIDLLEPDHAMGPAVAAAVDADYARAVEEMRRLNPLDRGGPHPVATVLRTGESLLLPAMESSFLKKIAQGEQHFQMMRRLEYHAAIVVPLVARHRVLGALSLLRLTKLHSYDSDDLVLAQELARRAALAVDNARLFAATSRLAHTLQDSLLPRVMPEIPGVRLTARYRAAQPGQEVGGDFYDAFKIAQNRWGLAIGDVCGKGAEAAALTALGRYTIRALAEHDVGTVLRRLNQAVIRDEDMLHHRFLTVLFASASLQGDELRLDVAAAGHPPPLVLRVDGRVEMVGAEGLLLGLDRDADYVGEQVRLRLGDRIVFYTDGLTDARAPERMLSEQDVVQFLADGRELHGDDLAGFLESRATGGAVPRDDIAIMVVEFVGDTRALAGAGELAAPQAL